MVELRAGDLLFTGTPAGVSALLPGDRVCAEVAGVGELLVDIAPSLDC
ncbi:fumarylacetoacetate hydrolase family protein [Acinetobacter baumannii]